MNCKYNGGLVKNLCTKISKVEWFNLPLIYMLCLWMFLNDTSRTSSAVESRVIRCWSNICYISDIRTTRPTLFWIAKFFHKRFSHSWLDGKNQENYDSFTVIQNVEFHFILLGETRFIFQLAKVLRILEDVGGFLSSSGKKLSTLEFLFSMVKQNISTEWEPKNSAE